MGIILFFPDISASHFEIPIGINLIGQTIIKPNILNDICDNATARAGMLPVAVAAINAVTGVPRLVPTA